jgi:hypothetical protein
MNMDAITLEDCIINYEVNNCTIIMNDGHVLGFVEEDTQDLLTPFNYN